MKTRLWLSLMGFVALACSFGMASAAKGQESGIRVARDIGYGQAGRVELTLNLALPKTGKGPFPAVVCIHGGGWYQGQRQDMDPMTELLARLRRGRRQLPPRAHRPLPCPDRGLQGSGALATGQRPQIPHQSRPYRRNWSFGRRPSLLPAGGHRQERRSRRQRRQSRAVQPRPGRGQFLWPHGLHEENLEQGTGREKLCPPYRRFLRLQ